jgi:hypothetical protein
MKISAETAGRLIAGFVHHVAQERLVIAPDLPPSELAEVVAFLEAVQITTMQPTGGSE